VHNQALADQKIQKPRRIREDRLNRQPVAHAANGCFVPARAATCFDAFLIQRRRDGCITSLRSWKSTEEPSTALLQVRKEVSGDRQWLQPIWTNKHSRH
jgi:hypothetical protein